MIHFKLLSLDNIPQLQLEAVSLFQMTLSKEIQGKQARNDTQKGMNLQVP